VDHQETVDHQEADQDMENTQAAIAIETQEDLMREENQEVVAVVEMDVIIVEKKVIFLVNVPT